MKPVGRIHIRYRNGSKSRYDEITGDLELDVEMRTLSYMRSDEIVVTIPLDAILDWAIGDDDQRLTKPVVVEYTDTRPEELDWDCDTNY